MIYRIQLFFIYLLIVGCSEKEAPEPFDNSSQYDVVELEIVELGYCSGLYFGTTSWVLKKHSGTYKFSNDSIFESVTVPRNLQQPGKIIHAVVKPPTILDEPISCPGRTAIVVVSASEVN